MHIQSQQTGDRFVNGFPVGVADVQEAGVTDLVVHCQTPGTSADCPPVAQMLHVRVLWTQGHAIKPQNRLVSENAALHWYVAPAAHGKDLPAGSTGAVDRAGMIEYHGTGLVRLRRSGANLIVQIEHAKMSPTSVSGPMADHLGPTTLSGTLTARIDPAQTAVALGEMRATLAASRTAGGAEARLHVGE